MTVKTTSMTASREVRIERECTDSGEQQERSVEQKALYQFTADLAAAVAVNPLYYSTKLLEKGVVLQSLVRGMSEAGKGDREKATELVLKVIDNVGRSPELFGILCPWMF